MAEFQDVMKQWNRMCEKQQMCYTCPADGLCSPVSDLCADMKTITALEGAIMRWATKHPEQIYPTWLEWLECNDIFYRKEVFPHVYSTTVGKKAFDHIPADIAQKLGIKPKDE